MGNHRFKLSYMMPNAWFYKLKDMTRTSSKKTTRFSSTTPPPPPKPIPISPPNESSFIPSRPSVYLPSKAQRNHLLCPQVHPRASDTQLPPDPPRTSKRKPRRRPSKPSPNLVASGGRCRVSRPESDDVASLVNVADQVRLPPILTRPNVKKENGFRPTIRRAKTSRGSSPKIGGRRSKGFGSSRSLARSIAVVKSSSDPEKDFRESMVEMIVENDIRHAAELEELLACYLSLNSAEYHDIIVQVFEQIWIELAQLKFVELENLECL